MRPSPWSWTSRLLFLVLITAWGFNFLFVRVGLTDASPLWLAFLRAAIGTATAAVLLSGLGGWGRLDACGRRDALVLGLPNTTAFYGLVFVSIQAILPGISAVLVYTFPLWVALLSPALLGHRMGQRHWGFVGAGFLGIALISLIGSTATLGVSLVPMAESLAAAVAWGVGTVLFQRRFSRAEMLEANVYQLIGGTAGLAVLTLLWVPVPLPTFTPALDVSLIWLGVLGTALAYSIWFDLLGRTRAATLSAYAFLVPVVAMIGSAIFFRETLAPLQLVGVALVLVSIYGIGRAPGAGEPIPPLAPAE